MPSVMDGAGAVSGISSASGISSSVWVTLPGATLDAMRPHIERGDEGVLVIAEDGSVRLETDDA